MQSFAAQRHQDDLNLSEQAALVVVENALRASNDQVRALQAELQQQSTQNQKAATFSSGFALAFSIAMLQSHDAYVLRKSISSWQRRSADELIMRELSKIGQSGAGGEATNRAYTTTVRQGMALAWRFLTWKVLVMEFLYEPHSQPIGAGMRVRFAKHMLAMPVFVPLS